MPQHPFRPRPLDPDSAATGTTTGTTSAPVTPAGPTRRGVLAGSVAGLALVGGARSASAAPAAPSLVRSRGTLPSGIQFGDVDTDSAVLWARADRPGRLMARLRPLRDGVAGRGAGLRADLARHGARDLVGPWAGPSTDLTAMIDVARLHPGCAYDVAMWFEDAHGVRSEVTRGSFVTAGGGATSFAWSGDVAGQGWGINPDVGGMFGFGAVAAARPDVFIHSGDHVYSDGPLAEKVVEKDGQVWRNVVTPEVSKVAETLAEFRGRFRYNQTDHHVRDLYAHVPVIGQWDDHETTNNWYPGEILRCRPGYPAGTRVDVLAARARRAFAENVPMAAPHRRRHGWYAPGALDAAGRAHVQPQRIYRTTRRGRHLDVFSLDMRTYRGPNPAAAQAAPVPMLGAAQVDWLVRELRASRATWKVVAADMPIGLIVGDNLEHKDGIEAVADGHPDRLGGREHEMARLLSQIKAHRIRNVVWVTADVHYASANHYDPARATGFTDFDPCYEFVAGALNAGSFGPSKLDATFGPKVLFHRTGDYDAQSPRTGRNQFFGFVDIDDAGLFTVSLRDATGATIWSTTLHPQH